MATTKAPARKTAKAPKPAAAARKTKPKPPKIEAGLHVHFDGTCFPEQTDKLVAGLKAAFAAAGLDCPALYAVAETVMDRDFLKCIYSDRDRAYAYYRGCAGAYSGAGKFVKQL
jgi:hypothetical protein